MGTIFGEHALPPPERQPLLSRYLHSIHNHWMWVSSQIAAPLHHSFSLRPAQTHPSFGHPVLFLMPNSASAIQTARKRS